MWIIMYIYANTIATKAPIHTQYNCQNIVNAGDCQCYCSLMRDIEGPVNVLMKIRDHITY